MDVGWAFMVARGRGMLGIYRRADIVRRPTAGDHEGLPFPASPPSPLQLLMGNVLPTNLSVSSLLSDLLLSRCAKEVTKRRW